MACDRFPSFNIPRGPCIGPLEAVSSGHEICRRTAKLLENLPGNDKCAHQERQYQDAQGNTVCVHKRAFDLVCCHSLPIAVGIADHTTYSPFTGNQMSPAVTGIDLVIHTGEEKRITLVVNGWHRELRASV